MTQTVSDAVATTEKTKEVAHLVSSYKDRFALILPKHLTTDTFTSLALSALRKPDLAKAAMNDPMSLVTALTHCARLGHQPNTEAFYLVPIRGKVEGWEGYRGIVERLYRSGGVSSVHAQIVRENDLYDFEEGMNHPIFKKPKKFATQAERGKKIGTFAYAKLRDGGYSRVVEMPAEDVYKRRDANPFSSDKKSPWQLWEDSMWLKCPTRELEKWVPSSAEYREQMALSYAAAVELARDENLPASTESDVWEGEVVDGGWPEVAPTGGAA